MQGRQNMSNTERKGPHKSMHCKFCKPPGVTTPEKPTGPHLETKTKLHLTHEAADLRVCNIQNEPGFPAIENEACVCVLEGENSCPKCAPDKTRPPPKKKVCRCPKGAKPHPSMCNETAPKKKKEVEEDDEFWWEKYSREHDALAKETWAAYMAQRRKDKKLEKCQKRERKKLVGKRTKSGAPIWYQRLSCQQMIYVEYLSTAIRLDSDENITDRTYFVLGGIGLHPRPKRKVLKRCLKYCHYNAIQFLNQLHISIKDEDPFQEKAFVSSKDSCFTWNERLLMNSLCYLEFPALLRELMDRLPLLPRTRLLPQIPYPVFPKLPKKKYDSPYQEPIWQDRLNWVEKMKIDRLNRCRLHMETKRIKIPPLALVRRPSLIDARPPFLAQIEANERASRILVKEKGKKPLRKHPISMFNSEVDVTAIAEIEASEISTTDKADTEDICVFLRDPKGSESIEGEGEGDIEPEPDLLPEKEVKFIGEPPKLETQIDHMGAFSDIDAFSEEGEVEVDDMPFKTPPKTESGVTIKSPCPPPDTTPGPPATHFDKGKRELDIRNEEICGFFPYVSSNTQTAREDVYDRSNDVESNLKSAAEKLKKFAVEEEGEEKSQRKGEKRCKKCRKREKCKRRAHKGDPKNEKCETDRVAGAPDSTYHEEAAEEGNEKEVLNFEEEAKEQEKVDEMEINFKISKDNQKNKSRRESEESDPDPDTEDEWSTRPPCLSDKGKEDEKSRGDSKRKFKRKKGKGPRRKLKKKKKKKKKKASKEKSGAEKESRQDQEKRQTKRRTKKGSITEHDDSNPKEEAEKVEKKAEVFKGDVEPLVQEIVKDLAEEGFYCASYPLLYKHPDINQLILHLKGEMLTKKLRELLRLATKNRWNMMKGLKKFPIMDLGISSKRLEKADWNDKNWISRLAKEKTDQFYYKVASDRALHATQFYDTLYQAHFGTERFHKIFYSYMTSKYEDTIFLG